MEKVNGTLNETNATLVYIESENPDKVNIVYSVGMARRACLVTFGLGVVTTIAAYGYYRMFKQLNDSKRK